MNLELSPHRGAMVKSAVCVLLFSSVGVFATVRSQPADPCEFGRTQFELIVAYRMLNYASTSDSWSERASQWAEEITDNVDAGQSSSALDSAFTRFERYCEEGDSFMAGLTLGEWIGIGLRDP